MPRAAVRGEPATSVVEVAFDSRDVVPGCLFFCVPGDRRGRPRLRGVRGGVGRGGPRGGALARRHRPTAGPRALRAGGDGTDVRGRVRSSRGGDDDGGRHRHERQDHAPPTCSSRSSVPTGGVPASSGRPARAWRARPVPLARTTPEAPDLHRLLARMRDAGVDTVAMEVSSHALDQHRVGGVVVRRGRLHEPVPRPPRLPPDDGGVLRGEGAAVRRPRTRAAAVRERGRPLGTRACWPSRRSPRDPSRSTRSADLVRARVEVDARRARRSGSATSRSARGCGAGSTCRTACAPSPSRATLDIEDAVTARGIDRVAGVPGRVEPVDAGQNFLVVVDYAHTPDSILHVLQAARPMTSGRIIVVFGCGGDRDREKRPLMGDAATANADLTVVTSDNPRSEDPLAIIARDRARRPRRGGGPLRGGARPPRRDRARGGRGARGGDTVVDRRARATSPIRSSPTGRVPFDDREVARDALVALGAAHEAPPDVRRRARGRRPVPR